MGKLKTRKVASSRVKISGTGKAMAWKAGKRHLSYHKSGSDIRGKGVSYVLADADQKRVLAMFPYGGK
jgi:large subunit ribosomal protein L35